MTLTDTKTNCLTAVVLENKVLGFPLVGVHVGGGIHVDMPATWDGNGLVPPGWTAYSDANVAPDGKGAFVTKLDDGFTTTTVAASPVLSVNEKTTATTLLNKAVAIVDVAVETVSK